MTRPALEVISRGTDSSGRALKGTRQMFEIHDTLNGMIGGILTPVQGAFNVGVSASAGTHDKAGCWDWRTWNLTTSQRELVIWEGRKRALAMFFRTVAQGFDEHLHGTLLPDAPMTPQTAWQASQYKLGRNMLASGGPDTHRRPVPLVTTYDYQGEPEMALTPKQDRTLSEMAQDVSDLKALVRSTASEAAANEARQAEVAQSRFRRQMEKLAGVADALGELERSTKDPLILAKIREAKLDVLTELRDAPETDGTADNPTDEGLFDAREALGGTR